MNRNDDIRKILASRQVSELQREAQIKAMRERDRKRYGVNRALDYGYVRDSRFPWK